MEAALGSSFLVGVLGVAALAWGAYSYACVATGVGHIVALIKELLDVAAKNAEAARERDELMKELFSDFHDGKTTTTTARRREVVYPYNFSDLERK